MFRPRSTKRDTFWPARPKRLDLGQVWLSEVCFFGTTRNFYVSTKFDQARYVSNGATKYLCFDKVRPSLTNRDTFRPARPKYLGFNQAQPSEIRFDQRDQNIYVSTTFDQARYVLTGATKTFMFRPSSTKFDQARYVSTGATKTSRFRPSPTERDTFQPARPKHQCFDHVRPSEIFFDRRDQNV